MHGSIYTISTPAYIHAWRMDWENLDPPPTPAVYDILVLHTAVHACMHIHTYTYVLFICAPPCLYIYRAWRSKKMVTTYIDRVDRWQIECFVCVRLRPPRTNKRRPLPRLFKSESADQTFKNTKRPTRQKKMSFEKHYDNNGLSIYLYIDRVVRSSSSRAVY